MNQIHTQLVMYDLKTAKYELKTTKYEPNINFSLKTL